MYLIISADDTCIYTEISRSMSQYKEQTLKDRSVLSVFVLREDSPYDYEKHIRTIKTYSVGFLGYSEAIGDAVRVQVEGVKIET